MGILAVSRSGLAKQVFGKLTNIDGVRLEDPNDMKPELWLRGFDSGIITVNNFISFTFATND